MQCNAAHTMVINEYGSNMWNFKFDPLVAIEAKSAIRSAYKQGWTLQSELEKESQIKEMMTNQTLGLATSPSPARGTQEEPRMDMSSQEEENTLLNVTQDQEKEPVWERDADDSEEVVVDQLKTSEDVHMEHMIDKGEEQEKVPQTANEREGVD